MGKDNKPAGEPVDNVEAIVKATEELAVYANGEGDQALVASTSTIAIATGGVIDHLLERPDNDLPEQDRLEQLRDKLNEIRENLGTGVDNELPGASGEIDNSLPPAEASGKPIDPDAPAPDQGLPGSQPQPDQGLPPSPGSRPKPGQPLPPSPAPKRY